MKITVATGPTFPVPAVRGGAVQRLWEGLAEEFSRRGHEVTVFARSYPGQPAVEEMRGVRFVRWGGYEQSTSIRRDLVRCLWYALRALRHLPSADIVVTNDFWMPALIPRWRRSAGRVVVNANRFPKGQYRLYGHSSAFAAASRIVAEAIAAEVPGAVGKISVVPNCVDTAFLGELAGVRSQQSAERPLRILFVGRLHPEKGLTLLARSLRELAGNLIDRIAWECVVVGPVSEGQGGGGQAYEEEVKMLARGLPVRFEDPVYDAAKLVPIYDGADIFVYPSLAERGESFGLAPLEAMARGVVPIVSDLAVFRDYLEPGFNGVVFDHRSPRADQVLALALADLLHHPEKRQTMGRAARTTAEKFSTQAVADKYLELFHRLGASQTS